MVRVDNDKGEKRVVFLCSGSSRWGGLRCPYTLSIIRKTYIYISYRKHNLCYYCINYLFLKLNKNQMNRSTFIPLCQSFRYVNERLQGITKRTYPGPVAQKPILDVKVYEPRFEKLQLGA